MLPAIKQEVTVPVIKNPVNCKGLQGKEQQFVTCNMGKDEHACKLRQSVRLNSIRPFHPDCSPGKSTSESSDDDVVPFSKFLFPFPEAKRNGTIGGIAVPFDI